MKKIFNFPKYQNIIKIIAIITLIIFLGLLSRKFSIIPYIVGDILRGMMVFFIMKLFLGNNLFKISIISLLICFGIEFSQLIQYDWLVNIRETQIGGILLGRGFLYSDLFANSIGILFSYILIITLGKHGE